jgi:hypothetical protein
MTLTEYLIYIAITVPGCIATGWWLGNKHRRWRRQRQVRDWPTLAEWLTDNPDRPHKR